MAVAVEGSNLIVDVVGVSSGQTYFVFSNTNLMVNQWVPIATNIPLNEKFSITNLINPTESQGFYKIQTLDVP